MHGRAEGTPMLFRPFSPMNSGLKFLSRLWRDGLFCFGGGGASQRFFWHRPFSQKGLYQKQFCPRIERLLANFGKVRANHSACVKDWKFLLRATSFQITIFLFDYDNLVHQLLGQDNHLEVALTFLIKKKFFIQ